MQKIAREKKYQNCSQDRRVGPIPWTTASWSPLLTGPQLKHMTHPHKDVYVICWTSSKNEHVTSSDTSFLCDVSHLVMC